MANLHYLRIWSAYFDMVASGKKRFEWRKNDRGFKEGDELVLQEWNPNKRNYTGRQVKVKVDCIVDEHDGFDITPGYVIMGITIHE